MRLKKRLNHRVPFPEPLRHETDRRPFLAIIGIILLVSFIGVLNHLEREAITGSAVQTIGFVKEGKEIAFEVKTAGINSATIHLTEDTKNAKISFEENLEAKPTVSESFYSVVEVSSDKAISFSSLDLTLKIEEEELLNKGIAVNDFQLYVNEQPVETTLTKKEGGYLFYTATATSFGEYVLGKKQVVQKTEKPVPAEPAEITPIVETPKVEDVESNVVGKAIQGTEKTGEISFWQKIKNFFSKMLG